jgi:hypothetical protein
MMINCFNVGSVVSLTCFPLMIMDKQSLAVKSMFSCRFLPLTFLIFCGYHFMDFQLQRQVCFVFFFAVGDLFAASLMLSSLLLILFRSSLLPVAVLTLSSFRLFSLEQNPHDGNRQVHHVILRFLINSRCCCCCCWWQGAEMTTEAGSA